MLASGLWHTIVSTEFTAVCIDGTGTATVFGGFPDFDDNAYFIQSNCGLTNQFPENCSPGNPLTWDLEGQALKVYQIKGDETGDKTFDLNSWQTGNGGEWQDWSALEGTVQETLGNRIDCTPLSSDDLSIKSIVVLYPNPVSNKVIIKLSGLPIQ